MQTGVEFTMVEAQCERSDGMDFIVSLNSLATVWDGEPSWVNVIRIDWFMQLKWSEAGQSLGLVPKSLPSSVLIFLEISLFLSFAWFLLPIQALPMASLIKVGKVSGSLYLLLNFKVREITFKPNINENPKFHSDC